MVVMIKQVYDDHHHGDEMRVAVMCVERAEFGEEVMEWVCPESWWEEAVGRCRTLGVLGAGHHPPVPGRAWSVREEGWSVGCSFIQCNKSCAQGRRHGWREGVPASSTHVCKPCYSQQSKQGSNVIFPHVTVSRSVAWCMTVRTWYCRTCNCGTHM